MRERGKGMRGKEEEGKGEERRRRGKLGEEGKKWVEKIRWRGKEDRGRRVVDGWRERNQRKKA